MLDVLWHLRGRVILDNTQPKEVVLGRLDHLLMKQQKTVFDRGPDYVAFNDPLWSNPSRPNWLAMTIYDRGRFWIELCPKGETVRYDLRSLHGIIFCLFGAAIFFLFGPAGGGAKHGIGFAAFAFGWLYGMNLLLALARVPRLIRRTLSGR